MQNRALNFRILPEGNRLTWNTQVPGMILDLAALIGTYFQVCFDSSPLISVCATSIHLFFSGDCMLLRTLRCQDPLRHGPCS